MTAVTFTAATTATAATAATIEVATTAPTGRATFPVASLTARVGSLALAAMLTMSILVAVDSLAVSPAPGALLAQHGTTLTV